MSVLKKPKAAPTAEDEEGEFNEITPEDHNADAIAKYVALRESLNDALSDDNDKKLQEVGGRLLDLGGKRLLRIAFEGSTRASTLLLMQVWNEVAEDWAD